MPEFIVPQAQSILALTSEIRAVRYSPFQQIYGLPKHTPQALVAALVKAAEALAFEADYKAQQLALSEKRVKQLEKSLGLPDWDQMSAEWMEQEESRFFMEACAAEHSFQNILR